MHADRIHFLSTACRRSLFSPWNRLFGAKTSLLLVQEKREPVAAVKNCQLKFFVKILHKQDAGMTMNHSIGRRPHPRSLTESRMTRAIASPFQLLPREHSNKPAMICMRLKELSCGLVILHSEISHHHILEPLLPSPSVERILWEKFLKKRLL